MLVPGTRISTRPRTPVNLSCKSTASIPRYSQSDPCERFADGDPYGTGFHADFINGWQSGVLQKAVDNCHCNPYGDFTCCSDAGIFTKSDTTTCTKSSQVDEKGSFPLSLVTSNKTF